jgi:hypothetical protein
MTDQLKKESIQQQVGAQLTLFPKKRKEMSGAERVQMYQRKLYLKAKQKSKEKPPVPQAGIRDTGRQIWVDQPVEVFAFDLM